MSTNCPSKFVSWRRSKLGMLGYKSHICVFQTSVKCSLEPLVITRRQCPDWNFPTTLNAISDEFHFADKFGAQFTVTRRILIANWQKRVTKHDNVSKLIDQRRNWNSIRTFQIVRNEIANPFFKRLNEEVTKMGGKNCIECNQFYGEARL